MDGWEGGGEEGQVSDEADGAAGRKRAAPGSESAPRVSAPGAADCLGRFGPATVLPGPLWQLKRPSW